MQDTNNYQMFNLIGNEFSFDVDLSSLPCGLNGALYFVSMPQAGQGTPGARYGTGKSYLVLFAGRTDIVLKDTATPSALVI